MLNQRKIFLSAAEINVLHVQVSVNFIQFKAIGFSSSEIMTTRKSHYKIRIPHKCCFGAYIVTDMTTLPTLLRS